MFGRSPTHVACQNPRISYTWASASCPGAGSCTAATWRNSLGVRLVTGDHRRVRCLAAADVQASYAVTLRSRAASSAPQEIAMGVRVASASTGEWPASERRSRPWRRSSNSGRTLRTNRSKRLFQYVEETTRALPPEIGYSGQEGELTDALGGALHVLQLCADGALITRRHDQEANHLRRD